MSSMTEQESAELDAKQVSQEAQDDVAPDQKQSDEKSQQLEATLKREREAREKAEKAAADLAFKLREKQRANKETETVEEEKPISSKEVEAMLAREREEVRKEMQSQRIEEIAGTFSVNDTEKQLIIELHKNRSFPSHLSLEEQIEECYLIANKEKIKGEISELTRAVSSRRNASGGSAGTHHEGMKGSTPKLAADEAVVYEQVGLKFNETSRMYEKKLPDGSTLIKDPKTKATRIVKA